jgi:hypothetical protein
MKVLTITLKMKAAGSSDTWYLFTNLKGVTSLKIVILKKLATVNCVSLVTTAWYSFRLGRG